MLAPAPRGALSGTGMLWEGARAEPGPTAVVPGEMPVAHHLLYREGTTLTGPARIELLEQDSPHPGGQWGPRCGPRVVAGDREQQRALPTCLPTPCPASASVMKCRAKRCPIFRESRQRARGGGGQGGVQAPRLQAPEPPRWEDHRACSRK